MNAAVNLPWAVLNGLVGRLVRERVFSQSSCPCAGPPPVLIFPCLVILSLSILKCMIFYINLSSLLIQIFGSILLYLDSVRTGSRLPPGGLVLDQPQEYHCWFYNQASLGFALLLFGFGLSAISLVLDRICKNKELSQKSKKTKL